MLDNSQNNVPITIIILMRFRTVAFKWRMMPIKTIEHDETIVYLDCLWANVSSATSDVDEDNQQQQLKETRNDRYR